jgi:TRAP-type mannitol/chloroaromatic compound transport system permease small subunit
MLTIVRGIDRLSQGVGVTVRWFFAAAMVIGAGNAISRRVFGASSNAFLELQWYLFAAAVLLGASYVLLKDAHVRVDFISSKLSPRTNAVFDALALMLVAISFCVMLIKYSWPMFEIAWRTGERSSNAGGLIRWPVLLCLPVGFGLLLLQACAETVKRIALIAGHGGTDDGQPR